MILGGKEKEDDFGRLAPLVAQKARRVLLVGAAGPSIGRALGALVGARSCRAGTLERAVESAAAARSGDVVLLSPACASFDQFRNFEHRGEVFERS